MLNAINLLVGSSRHVFFLNIFIKLCYCQKRRNFRFLGKTTYVIKKVIKTAYNALWLLLFFPFLLSYERLRTYFQTSAQVISAILATFEAGITQKRLDHEKPAGNCKDVLHVVFYNVQVIFQMSELEILLFLTT